MAPVARHGRFLFDTLLGEATAPITLLKTGSRFDGFEVTPQPAPYNGAVDRATFAPHMAVLSADTTAGIEQRQIDRWRQLSPLERLRLASDTTRAVTELSLSGIRRRHPDAGERECFLRLAAILLGVDTARRVYPDAATLTDLRGPS